MSSHQQRLAGLVDELGFADRLSLVCELMTSIAQDVADDPSVFTPDRLPGEGQSARISRDIRGFEAAAKQCQTISRSADVALHVFAGAHEDATFAHDEWVKNNCRDYDVYDPNERWQSAEFAHDALGMALGVSSATAGRLSREAKSVSTRFPDLVRLLSGGEGRFQVAAVVADELEHLDSGLAGEVMNQLVKGGVLVLSVQGARERARRLLRLRGLEQPVDEQVPQDVCGVRFMPHLDFDCLTEMNATLPALDAARLDAAIEERARFLQANTTLEQGAGGAGRLSVLRGEALIDLALNNVQVETVLHLRVPVFTPEMQSYMTGADGRTSRAGSGAVLQRGSFDGLDLGHGQPHDESLDLRGLVSSWPPFTHVAWVGAPSRRVSSREDTAPGIWPPPNVDANRPASQGKTTCMQSRLAHAHSVGLATPSSDHESTATDSGQHLRVVSTGTDQVNGEVFDAAAVAPGFDVRLGAAYANRMGNIPAAIVEQIARMVDTRFVIEATDTTWVTTATSTKTYRPTAGIVRMVKSRDAHCRFPHCTRSVEVCDLDHVIPYSQGGETTPSNLQALCRHHHRAKTFGGFAVVMDEAGVCLWESPPGQRWVTRPTGETETAAPVSTTA